MGGKQKVVVRVPCCVKGRSIAFKTVARVPGVSSVSLLEGEETDQMVVTGEEIDSYGLIKSLKKKVGCVQLLTVGPDEEKKPPSPKPKPDTQSEDDKDKEKPIESVPCFCQSGPCFCQTVPRLCRQEHVTYVCELCNPEPICVIM